MEIKIDKIKIELIAIRQAPGDRYRLVSDGPEGKIYTSLTNTLEAYIVKTKFVGDFKLSPLKGELYTIATSEKEIEPKPIKKYSIYGEF